MSNQSDNLNKQITELEDARHKLEISETKFRKLFETAKDGILLIDPDTDKIIDANPYLLELIGYTLKEVMGKELWELGVLKDAELSKDAFQELKVKGYIHYENLPLLRRDGREISVEFVSNLYPLDGVGMIQCNIRDITDRKIAQDKAKIYLESLEKMNGFMTGREIKMIELKKEIEELKKKILQQG